MNRAHSSANVVDRRNTLRNNHPEQVSTLWRGASSEVFGRKRLVLRCLASDRASFVRLVSTHRSLVPVLLRIDYVIRTIPRKIRQRSMTYDKYLETIYYDPVHPASFSGLDKLYRAVRKEGKYVINKAKIKAWLLKQESYTLHKGVIRKHKRQNIVSSIHRLSMEIDTAIHDTAR